MSLVNVSVKMEDQLLNSIKLKAKEVGMTASEIIRLAAASFLAKENSLSEFLDAIDPIYSQLAVLTKRQEQFARTIGSLCVIPEQRKTEDTKQLITDRFNQIIETVN